MESEYLHMYMQIYTHTSKHTQHNLFKMHYWRSTDKEVHFTVHGKIYKLQVHNIAEYVVFVTKNKQKKAGCV